MATPAQRAANRANAAKSTGPRSVEGKEAARRNALKHGMTGAGVVLAGEDEQEVAVREAALRAQLVVDDGDALGGALVRQMAIATVRVEWAFRHETAVVAARVRKAPEVFDDARLVLAQEILGQIDIDPVTIRRRLLAAPEGIDALVVRLRALREKTVSTRIIEWDQDEGKVLDQILGNRPDQTPLSRAACLTRAIVFDSWVGIDPAEVEGDDFQARLLWAVAAVGKLIDTEIASLLAFKSQLDTTRRDRDRAEAGERSLLDLGPEGTALRRYANAAERTMLKMLQELRLARAEAREHAVAATLKAEVRHCRNLVDDTTSGLHSLVCHGIGTPTPCAADHPEPHGVGVPIPWHPEICQGKDRLDATRPQPTRPDVIEVHTSEPVPGDLASFCSSPRECLRPVARGTLGPLEAAPGASFAPIAAGRAPVPPRRSRS